ncbi:MAG TPA: nitrophenyl compound nitroreductase subunit ArsF family protein, partial [Thermodesulfovibrionales bacterium]|nr:nitrophenyl compound nitroreductase subunit ArsF family protein [Thermodesulfovibrionales bacterium]
VAYYFHGTFRCTTCKTIEKYSHDAIYQYFSRELSSGKLEFEAVNVEDPESRHYIQDYQLFSKSLVLVLYKDGKQVKWKLLKEVWTYVGDKDKFFQYVKDETEGFLREAQ